MRRCVAAALAVHIISIIIVHDYGEAVARRWRVRCRARNARTHSIGFHVPIVVAVISVYSRDATEGTPSWTGPRMLLGTRIYCSFALFGHRRAASSPLRLCISWIIVVVVVGLRVVS